MLVLKLFFFKFSFILFDAYFIFNISMISYTWEVINKK